MITNLALVHARCFDCPEVVMALNPKRPVVMAGVDLLYFKALEAMVIQGHLPITPQVIAQLRTALLQAAHLCGVHLFIPSVELQDVQPQEVVVRVEELE